MSAPSLEMLLGGLQEGVKNIGQQMSEMRTEMREDQEKADKSRANVHKRLDEQSDKQAALEVHFAVMSKDVTEMKSVTDEVVSMRQQAQGAGTLGRWLLRIGSGILVLAGWVTSAYMYFAARPPP